MKSRPLFLLILTCAGCLLIQSSTQAQGTSGLSALEKLDPLWSLLLRSVPTKLRDGESLTALGVQQSDGIETLRLQSWYQGLEVLGSQVHLHRTPKGEFTTDHRISFVLSPNPKLPLVEALRLATEDSALRSQLRGVLKILPNFTTQKAKLIYQIRFPETSLWQEWWLDAQTGQILAQIPKHRSLLPINIYDGRTMNPSDIHPDTGAPNRFDLPKLQAMVIEGQATVHADASAYRAQTAIQKIQSYFDSVHHRLPLKPGMQSLHSVVHAGKQWANAYYSRYYDLLAFGDGDQTETRDFTFATDIVGHELTHLISATTPGFYYYNESGALDEGIADVFGILAAGNTQWILGKAIFLYPAQMAHGIRDLASPEKNRDYYRNTDGSYTPMPHPRHLSERFPPDAACTPENDLCYVHGNATIPGHLLFLIAQKWGNARLEKVLYLSMTHFLSPLSDFKDFRRQFLAACEFLTPNNCDIAAWAFDQAGISEGITSKR